MAKQAYCRLHGPRRVADNTATSRLLRLRGVHDLAQQLRIFDCIRSSALSKAIRAELVRLYGIRLAAISAPDPRGGSLPNVQSGEWAATAVAASPTCAVDAHDGAMVPCRTRV